MVSGSGQPNVKETTATGSPASSSSLASHASSSNRGSPRLDSRPPRLAPSRSTKAA